MRVTISPELEQLPYWQEIRDYVNERMAEEGWDDSIVVRLLTREEETQLQESGMNVLVTRREGGTIVLAVGLGKYFECEEIIKLDREFGIETDRSVLMLLWIAQMVWMGKSLGGCDS